MKVGTVCYATRQGLGILAKSFYDAGVFDQVAVFIHPHKDRQNYLEWYKQPFVFRQRPFIGIEAETFLRTVDVVVFFETPFDWEFVNLCKKRGVRTVIIPMYEWSLIHPPYKFDKTINPSLLDQQYFPDGVFLPIPVETKYWEHRTTARSFLHNGGNLGARGHKGTLELLKALPYVKSPISLTVRSQVPDRLKVLADEARVSKDPRLTIDISDIAYERQWIGFDAVVIPEKFNGLSLPLQESRAAGMLVITTDRFPANTWLPKEPLIPVKETGKAQVCRGHMEFEECHVTPEDIAQTIDEWFDRDISDYSLSGKKWAEDNSWASLKTRWIKEITC